MAGQIFPSTFVPDFHDKDDLRKMQYSTLGSTGLSISHLSLGASSFGSVFRKTDDWEAVKVVHQALKSGINLIDCAPWYGHGKAEAVLGKALKGIPRASYYISTKVGRYLPELDKQFDFSAERTLKSVDESLGRLGLDSVDIIQVHDMEFAPSLDVIIHETLPALQKVKESGKAKFIGITGYPLENFRTVIERSQVPIDTVLTYCHYSINDTSLQDYLPYFKEKGVGVINASPVSMGLLSSRGPPLWHPATQETRDKCYQAVQYCQEKGVDISKLALHFTLANQDIPTTLVSTASLENLKKNIAAVTEELTPAEQQVLSFIREKFFVPYGNMSWEGMEVAQYWEKLKYKKEQCK